MKKLVSVAATVFYLSALVVSADADTVFSNFGAGDSYDPNGWEISDGSLDARQYIACPFTPGNNITLTSIDLAAFLIYGNSFLVVDLRSDSGRVPGPLIESWTLTNFGVDPRVISVDSILNPVLTAGAQYWLELRTTDPTTDAGWNLSLGDGGPFVFSQDGGATWSFSNGQTRPVYRVTGTPTAGSS